MIDFENDEKKKIFSVNLLHIVIAIVIAVILTYVIIYFIPFSNMLDSFKVSFKADTLDNVVKYYSLTLAIIIIPIYTVLYFLINALIKFIYNKIKLKKEE